MLISAIAGSLPPRRLSPAIAAEIDAQLHSANYNPTTLYLRAKAVQQILRHLWEYHDAPKLADHITRHPRPRPRNVTLTEHERTAILDAAQPHMRLWLLLCSDLAMRSGTAFRIGPEHYDRWRHTLTFTTKYGEKLTLPTTDEIDRLISLCPQEDGRAYVHQLWLRDQPQTAKLIRGNTPLALNHKFQRLCASVGIKRYIRPHDLRRTTAVAMLNHSRDVREVQALLGHKNLASTFWYLDHDLRPIKRSTLELIKRPAWRKEQSA